MQNLRQGAEGETFVEHSFQLHIPSRNGVSYHDQIRPRREVRFGKRLRHNLQIMSHLALLHLTGCPILLGASRKSFIASAVDRGTPAKGRLPGSLTAALAALDQGVQILRVHDVAETWQAAEVWRGIRSA